MPGTIIALLGSPLPHGNTAKLLEQAVRGARDAGCEVEVVDVPSLEFGPCMELFYCNTHETCEQIDEVTPYYEKMKTAGGLIVASPIMTFGIPGKLKSFMDRFQVFYMAKYGRKQSLVPKEIRKGRKGLFISIAGMNIPNVFDGAKLTVLAFFDILDITYWGELLRNDMDRIQDVATEPGLFDAAYKKGFELGKAVIESGA